MTVVQPAGWPRPRGYSSGVDARGRLVFVAGQVGWNPLTERIESEDFVHQARQALCNVVAVLGAADAAPVDVVRFTWYITDRDEYVAARGAVGEAYRQVMGRHYPAMSVVIVAALIEPGAKIEIEATAVVPDSA
jgi:enamine deaminase RidA (YjgF/YER057c/UK114 family)